MTFRPHPSVLVIVLMAGVFAGAHLVAAGPNVWKAPRTPDGHPDLQGYWTNDSVTPVERDPELGNKEYFTPQESAAFLKRRMDRIQNQARNDIHYDDSIWQGENYSREANLRTSLVFDPPDGRLPALTPDARVRDAARTDARRTGPSDSAASRSLAERCISWGNVGPPMLPPNYNANMQIIQTRDHVVIRHEMMHDARIIALNGAPHVGPNVRMLAGDARGHWEGDTLVVETTNFTNSTNFRGAPQTTRQDIFASDGMRVVERFTRVDATTIQYDFTVTDPKTWTRSWSGSVPMRSFEGPIYEYACHEGNYGLANILRGARVQESEDRRESN
jgi:hypothetical protein